MMQKIGVQTKNVITDENPAEGFALLRQAGFTCTDFSLNSYLLNTELYRLKRNAFFSQSERELENFFAPTGEGLSRQGLRSIRCICPIQSMYPRLPES